MIELFLNSWNEFNMTENHAFDTKIKKISWEVTELWQLEFW